MTDAAKAAFVNWGFPVVVMAFLSLLSYNVNQQLSKQDKLQNDMDDIKGQYREIKMEFMNIKNDMQATKSTQNDQERRIRELELDKARRDGERARP